MAPKQPPQISAGYLHNAALYYLKRFSSNRKRVERVLREKVRRSVYVHGGQVSDYADLLNTELDRLQSAGYIDEMRFAEQKFSSYRRRGYSTRQIQQRLRKDGVPQEVEQALFDSEENEDPDLEAARTYARKKRLGYYSSKEQNRENQQKDLARMARAGFSYSIAKQALSTEDALYLSTEVPQH